METANTVTTAPGLQGNMFEDDFANGLEHWIAEGPPGTIIKVEDGSVLLDPREAQHRPEMGIEGLNLWCKVPLAGNWRMVYDLEPIAPVVGDGEKCNLLFMFDCRYQDPALDILATSFKRTGSYIWLHGKEDSRQHYEKAWNVTIPPMDGYTITYYRMAPQSERPYQLVARRNPGFHLIARADQTPEDQWNYRHQVAIERRGNQVTFYQNDALTFRFEDTGEHGPPLTQGYWGFRTWRAAVRLFGVRVDALD